MSLHQVLPIRRFFAFFLLASFVAGLALLPAYAADERVKKLPKYYREWLERDVVYIIAKFEKDAFLALNTDQERDKFIADFWEVRNPTRGAPSNPFKDEHYRRLNYANQYFGRSNKDGMGWKSAKGEIYIKFGEPKQKDLKYGSDRMRPVEIWFYSFDHSALPPFFYVMFYQREMMDDWRLYSPYFDGPERLAIDHKTIGDRMAALKSIEEAVGREMALRTLTLTTNEPINWNDPRPTMTSDLILATMDGIQDHPFTVDKLKFGWEMLRSAVTHRMILPGDFLNVLTVPLRDATGQPNLHFVLRMNRPEDFGLAQDKERYYFNIEVETKVFTTDNKPVFTTKRKLTRYLNRQEFLRMKGRPFGYEGMLPLAPGKYKVEFILTNLLTQTAYRSQKDVVIPELNRPNMRISDLVPFAETMTVGADSAAMPFAAAGMKFVPLFDRDLDLAPGQELKMFYQVWLPENQRAAAGQKLGVDYAYGRLSVSGDAKNVSEEVAMDQFDGNGVLLTGKKFDTLGMQQGRYFLSTTIVHPVTREKTFGRMMFQVVPGEPKPLPWDVYDDDKNAEEINNGTFDVLRGKTYAALGDHKEATAWYERALKKNPSNETAKNALVTYYYEQQRYADVAQLFARPESIGTQPDEQLVMRVADSFDRTGETQKAIATIEAALAVTKSPSAPMYIGLANYYTKVGNAAKAAEAERKGKSLIASAS